MPTFSLLANLDLSAILAQGVGDAGAGGGFIGSFGMMAVILGIFYFLLIRPQQKEAKEHTTLLAALQKGDKVVTASGLHGKIFEVREAEVLLEVADKMRVTVDKSAVKRKIAVED
jgi:preprotein translocase subunit YajC